MRTPKTINHILRSQEPASAADKPMTSWRCQFCGRRFTDRTELREHLDLRWSGGATKVRPDKSHDQIIESANFRSLGPWAAELHYD